jgi:short-subunit dehydrogenase involved in D-alanine esterification of teichoic acids
LGPLSLGFDEAKMQGEGRLSQRVLITAGAAGIGREFARAFAATGARVFVCDIDEAALAAIAREIPGVIA